MLIALILTIIIECTVLYLLKERDIFFYIYWIALTSFTNLSANLYLAFVFKGNQLQYWVTAIIVEIVVFVVEFLLSLIYSSDKSKSARYSLVCNLSSFLIGLIIF